MFSSVSHLVLMRNSLQVSKKEEKKEQGMHTHTHSVNVP